MEVVGWKRQNATLEINYGWFLGGYNGNGGGGRNLNIVCILATLKPGK